jgi:L-fuculose-phosphate aldolase
MNPIGVVENEYHLRKKHKPGGSPHPYIENKSMESRIILKPELIDGLTGYKPGQQMMVLFNFHRSEQRDLLQHPRADKSKPKRGVFNLRSPHRPNPIGVTVVEILNIDDNVITVRGLDAIDGTPILDLKPV